MQAAASGGGRRPPSGGGDRKDLGHYASGSKAGKGKSSDQKKKPLRPDDEIVAGYDHNVRQQRTRKRVKTVSYVEEEEPDDHLSTLPKQDSKSYKSIPNFAKVEKRPRREGLKNPSYVEVLEEEESDDDLSTLPKQDSKPYPSQPIVDHLCATRRRRRRSVQLKRPPGFVIVQRDFAESMILLSQGPEADGSGPSTVVDPGAPPVPPLEDEAQELQGEQDVQEQGTKSYQSIPDLASSRERSGKLKPPPDLSFSPHGCDPAADILMVQNRGILRSGPSNVVDRGTPPIPPSEDEAQELQGEQNPNEEAPMDALQQDD